MIYKIPIYDCFPNRPSQNREYDNIIQFIHNKQEESNSKYSFLGYSDWSFYFEEYIRFKFRNLKIDAYCFEHIRNYFLSCNLFSEYVEIFNPNKSIKDVSSIVKILIQWTFNCITWFKREFNEDSPHYYIDFMISSGNNDQENDRIIPLANDFSLLIIKDSTLEDIIKNFIFNKKHSCFFFEHMFDLYNQLVIENNNLQFPRYFNNPRYHISRNNENPTHVENIIFPYRAEIDDPSTFLAKNYHFDVQNELFSEKMIIDLLQNNFFDEDILQKVITILSNNVLRKKNE